MKEGSSWEYFDPISAIKKQSIDKFRTRTKGKGSRSYKSPNSAEVHVKSLNDDDSWDKVEYISENGDEEGFIFSRFRVNNNNNKNFWLLNAQNIIMLCCFKRF